MNTLFKRSLQSVLALTVVIPSLSYGITCSDVWPGSYPFLCRGKVPYTYSVNPGNGNRSNLSIEFNSATARGAGTEGQYLPVGVCAFVDRPVRPFEASYLQAEFRSAGENQVAQDVKRCAANSNCVFNVCVKNNGRDTLIFHSKLVNIHFPTFQ
ncbi:MAG: hypothetical protein NDI69_11090 [Bacteriovoracaceae bacterium]|nr:hypothetical protein [Bacteriovoracaceae bacterium]